MALAVSPDGHRIAAGLKDRSVRIWDAESGAELRRFAGLERDTACLAFAPDGRTLASGEGGPAPWEPRDVGLAGISLRDVATGRELVRWGAHQSCVRGLAFAPDGRTLTSAGTRTSCGSGTCASGREAHPARGAPRRDPGHRLRPRRADRGDRRLRRDAPRSGTRPTAPSSRRAEAGRYPLSSLALSADGALLASGGQDSLRLWEPATLRELRRFGSMAGSDDRAALSPDGRVLASMADGGVRLWETASGDRAMPSAGPRTILQRPGFLGDGAIVAARDRGTSVRFCGSPRQGGNSGADHVRGDGPPHRALARRPVVLAVAEAACVLGTVRSASEVATGREVGRLGGHLGLVRAMAFSPDGRLLATGADRPAPVREARRSRIWDLASGRLFAAAQDPHPSGRGAGAAPDGPGWPRLARTARH